MKKFVKGFGCIFLAAFMITVPERRRFCQVVDRRRELVQFSGRALENR